MENKELDIDDAADKFYYAHIDNDVASYDAFSAGADYVIRHLQPEIDRLKGLIEEAYKRAYQFGYNDRHADRGDNCENYLKQFKQKHGL